MTAADRINREGKNNSSSAYILKLNKSLYGLKQGSFNWNMKLKEALLARGFMHGHGRVGHTTSDIFKCPKLIL